ncbi:MAG: L-serine ammonia-lyase, iron-sulfur-dependent subunit beta [Gallicola sp.]|nr:L-serine ammonia-lyase, iron-sulfur-dependent subunit beta [Gallicola sp.]
MKYGIFDVMGPIMIGPSSSHTAGAVKIANTALYIAGEGFKKVEFILYGSFAKTYKGHGTDKALLAGIMGFLPDDERIRDSFEIAKENGIRYEFSTSEDHTIHANTVKIILTYEDGSVSEIVGASIGGGNILITNINGIKIEFNSKYPTILLKYKEQLGIIAKVSTYLSQHGYSIAGIETMREDNHMTLVIDLYDELSEEDQQAIENMEGFVYAKYVQGYRRGIQCISRSKK